MALVRQLLRPVKTAREQRCHKFRRLATATGAILRLGDRRLRNESRPVPLEDLQGNGCLPHYLSSADADTHAALATFRAAHGFGRATAAPQVGHAICLVAFDIGRTYGDQYSPDGSFRPFSMINPAITFRSEATFTMWDDCMSLVDSESDDMLMVRVRRHCHVSVRFMDLQGRQYAWEHLPVPLSELVQHEIDHLHGKLAVDLAEAAPDLGIMSGIVPRSLWLADYDKMCAAVDYEIQPTT